MRKTNYWKETCLILIGLITGYVLSPSLPIKSHGTIVVHDTITVHDTIVSKIVCNKENV